MYSKRKLEFLTDLLILFRNNDAILSSSCDKLEIFLSTDSHGLKVKVEIETPVTAGTISLAIDKIKKELVDSEQGTVK